MVQAMGGKKARRFKFEDFMLWRADGPGARRRNRGFGEENGPEDDEDD